MHTAAAGGHLEMIKFLVPLFKDRLHKKDEGSYTILHFAAQYGHSEVARYLIQEMKMDPQDRDKVCGVAVNWDNDLCFEGPIHCLYIVCMCALSCALVVQKYIEKFLYNLARFEMMYVGGPYIHVQAVHASRAVD